MNGLTDEQVAVLLKGIALHRVKIDRNGMSYVEQWDIRAMLNRVFGFCGWSLTYDTVPMYEVETTTGQGKPAFDVAYRSRCVLTIEGVDAQYEGTAVGHSRMPDYLRHDAHDGAVKNAESYALKRAAINLGDQFGLSLYNDGQTTPVVKRVVGFNTDDGVGS